MIRVPNRNFICIIVLCIMYYLNIDPNSSYIYISHFARSVLLFYMHCICSYVFYNSAHGSGDPKKSISTCMQHAIITQSKLNILQVKIPKLTTSSSRLFVYFINIHFIWSPRKCVGVAIH